MQTQLIRLEELCERLQLSRSTIYRMVKEDRIAQPMRIGRRKLAWTAESVESWIAGQAAAVRAKAVR